MVLGLYHRTPRDADAFHLVTEKKPSPRLRQTASVLYSFQKRMRGVFAQKNLLRVEHGGKKEQHFCFCLH